MMDVVDGWRCEAPKLHKQTKKASSELAHARTRARARTQRTSERSTASASAYSTSRAALALPWS